MKQAAVAFSVLVLSGAAMAQDLPRPSPKAQIMQSIGVNDVTVSYGRPAVRGREIFGGLVPYDQVWRTGANEASTIKFTMPAAVEGKALPAGIYSIHTIPGRDRWTLIFNSVAEQWGSYQYDAAKDVLRVEIAPLAIPAQERLTFSFPVVTDNSAVLALDWDTVRLPIRITVDTNEQVLAGLRTLMAGNPEDWRIGVRAATWAHDAGVARDEAMAWVEQSIARSRTYGNMALKARMLARAGNYAAAVNTAEEAIALGRAAQPAANVSALEQELAQWRESSRRR